MKYINNIDLRHLRYFVAVAELGSFSKAAVRLGIAQPPLSQQIKDLEHRLGVALFVRAGRGTMLSEAGRAFLPEAKALLDKTQETLRRIYRVGQGETGLLRIGMMNTAPHNPQILKLLQRYAARYPDVRIEPMMMSSTQQRSALLADDIDLALHWPWEGKPPPSLSTVTLTRYRFCLAVAAHHALAAKGKALTGATLGQLANETWYAVGGQYNRAWHDFTLQFLQCAGLPQTAIVERNPALFGLVLPIAACQGVGLLPDFLAPILPQIKLLPLPRLRGLSNSLPLCLSRHRAHQRGLIANFYAFAKAMCAD